jgi:hypothetical protein
MDNTTLRLDRVTIVADEKHKIIRYCLCVPVALVIYHEMRMLRIILTSVACRAVPYFPALSHKRNDFREKTVLNVKCVF